MSYRAGTTPVQGKEDEPQCPQPSPALAPLLKVFRFVLRGTLRSSNLCRPGPHSHCQRTGKMDQEGEGGAKPGSDVPGLCVSGPTIQVPRSLAHRPP